MVALLATSVEIGLSDSSFPQDLVVVIARCTGNSHLFESWLPNLTMAFKPNKIYVMEQCGQHLSVSGQPIVDIPLDKNIGDECHAYLSWIVQNYKDLPEYVMFLQGCVSYTHARTHACL